MLNKLGYTFPISDLSDNDVNVYNVIEDEIAKIKKEDLKKRINNLKGL